MAILLQTGGIAMTEPGPWLDRWRAANDGYDGLGRPQPRRMFTVPGCLMMIARIEPARVRRIPVSAIAEEGVDDNGGFSMVACPCGAKPVAQERLAKCPGCERYYVHVRVGNVYVVYGAMEPPPLPGSSSSIDSPVTRPS